MVDDLPTPPKGAVFYEDKKLYAALASQPITKGHCVVVWKKKVADLHLLNDKDYDYLMGIVDEVRDSMLKTLNIKKVYLLYMDEAKHVHWHLIPRYNKIGFNVLRETPKDLKSVSLAEKLKEYLKLK